jgi:phage shock protein PspC (stress-responsive transcriptional regulator)
MENKKLYRSQDDRIFGGVAGGLAEYFEIDSLITRLLWVLLIFSGGIGLLLYIIAWVLIPNDPKGNGKTAGEEMRERIDTIAQGVKEASKPKNKEKKESYTFSYVFGALLIILGIGLFFQNIIGINFWENFWPLIFIIIGIMLILKVREK